MLVVDGAVGLTADDRRLLALFEEKQVPYLVVMNKCDVGSARLPAGSIAVSARTGEGIEVFKKRLAAFGVAERRPKILVGDLVMPGDITVLVIPIDSSAPKGRLILPQQMVIRDLAPDIHRWAPVIHSPPVEPVCGRWSRSLGSRGRAVPPRPRRGPTVGARQEEGMAENDPGPEPSYDPPPEPAYDPGAGPKIGRAHV